MSIENEEIKTTDVSGKPGKPGTPRLKVINKDLVRMEWDAPESESGGAEINNYVVEVRPLFSFRQMLNLL